MRILILLAGVAAVAGAAEPTSPRPSSASRAWATRPATPPEPPAESEEKAAAEKPAAAPAAPAPAAAKDEKPSAALEPRVQTSAPVATPAATPMVAPVAASAPASRPAATAAAASAAGTRGVRDRLELDTTQITGNRELPRVMYVVPWKSADLGDLAGRPVNSLLDEALTPVDRDVFRRQNRYYQALRPDTDK